MSDQESVWKRRLDRERSARKQAENLLDSKSLELWETNQQLARLNDELEERIVERTHELDDARVAAEAASRTKSLFLASMSHEIRTPLNAVLGMNRLLLETGLDDEQHDLANSMLTSAEHLLGLINDVLDLSKFEAGKLDLEEVEFDLRRLAEECCELFADSAQAAGVELHGALAPGTPERLVGDPGRLRQVLINLIGNAVKFTTAGEVALRIEARESGPGRVRLRVAVSDTGIGIPGDKLQHIFETFSQVDASTTRRFGGTGLGLAICRLIVENMGGELAVHSTLGEGSTFQFEVELGLGEESTQDLAELRVGLEGYRALVMAPYGWARAALLDELGGLGLSAEPAPQAEALEAQLRSGSPPDLVLIDDRVEEGEVEGLLEVASEHEVLLVRLTTTVRRGRGAHLTGSAVRELAKPLRRADLLRLLRSIAGLVPDSRWSAEGDGEGPLLELEGGRPPRILLAEDNPINQRLAERVLAKFGVEIEIVSNGRESLAPARSGRFDLVLMDCQMPEMDGFEATARIRQWEADHGGRVPVIAMTANAMAGDRQRCLDSGMDDYISKPFKPEVLRQLLVRWLAVSAARRSA